MVKAARKHDRVFQTGSMQRSSSEFLKACELVRNGRIGKVKQVIVDVGGPSALVRSAGGTDGAGAGLELLARSGPDAALQLDPQPARRA